MSRILPVLAALLILCLVLSSRLITDTVRPHYVQGTVFPILFLHGYSGVNYDDCNNWADAKSYFTLHGWTGRLITVGYYSADLHCDVSIVNWSALHDPSDHCIYQAPGNEGTNNEDLRHVACELLWYLWDNFGIHSWNADIVAHSMGGLIARWAIANHGSSYPPAKYVQDIQTTGTPMKGMVTALDGSFQAQEMVSSSTFMQSLILNGENPQATDGTQWTMIGSNCDSLGLGMDGGIKVKYLTPCYTHSIYYNDVISTNDAVVDYSINQPRDVENLHSTTYPHMDHDMLLAMSGLNY